MLINMLPRLQPLDWTSGLD